MANKKTLALDRVMGITCGMILDRHYSDISVAEIAAQARCSTATIYEVYDTKDNLYIDALAQLLLTWAPPAPSDDQHGALPAILSYTRARIEYFAHPRTRAMFRALRERSERGAVVAQQLMETRASFGSLVLLVEQAFAENMLRSSDPESVAYLIVAGAIYEATAVAEVFGVNSSVDVAHIMGRIFTPLTLPEGQAVLERFLEEIPLDVEARKLPLSAQHIQAHEELQCSAMMRKTLIGVGVPSPYDNRH